MGSKLDRYASGAALAVLLLLAGCASAYYAGWEKLGREKRDLLRSHIAAARDEQQQASEQFQDALEQLKQLYGFEGGELEQLYDKLRREYERSADKADDVHGRIERARKTARDLFTEWEQELEQISSQELRRKSRRKLEDTRDRFGSLDAAMRRAAASMDPVLVKLKDQVLYLKHNLNAQAIGALEAEAADIEDDVAALLANMKAAILEADAFIEQLPE